MKCDEVWKPVEGFEGLYEVSSYGNVRSLNRALTNRFNINKYRHGGEHTFDATFVRKGRVLKPGCDGLGYYHFRLAKNGNYTLVKAHRLVAKHFCDDYFEGCVVVHVNGDRKDNGYTNLRCLKSRKDMKWK